jgi:TRAP-type C4-dicarboxylate transport system permease small subunit
VRAVLVRASRVLSTRSTMALWFSGICLVLMTVVVAWQVFGRYVLGRTPTYAEALSVTLMGWFIFLGAAVGVRERYHLGFDVLLYFLPARAKIILRAISDAAIFAFGFGMTYYGIQLAASAWSALVPTLGVPGGVSYFPIIVGGALVCLFTVERSLQRLAGMNPDDDEVVLDGDEPQTINK